MKYKIENIEDILDEEYTNISELCDHLNSNRTARTEFKNHLRRIVNEEDEKTIRRLMGDEFMQWVKEHCYINSEDEISGSDNRKADDDNTGEEDPTEPPETVEATSPIMPESVSDIQLTGKAEIKEQFEKSDYLNVVPGDDYFDYSEGIVIRENGLITEQKRIEIYLSDNGISLDTKKLLMVEKEGNQVLAVGHLIPCESDDTTYTVVFDDKNFIDYALIKNCVNVRFVLYGTDGRIYSKNADISYKGFEVEKERPLCIDFGTSNTSAGSYGILNPGEDQIEIVRFLDVTAVPVNTQAVMLPTLVYVEDCSDPSDIKYLFGYEARKRIEDEHYESKASVFYEIKRWMVSVEEEEEIRDNCNNKATPKRKDIIKAYLDYVIECAEQYFETRFEKLHFSAPVKLKASFVDILAGLYAGQKIVMKAEDSIDEGLAIVYNQIIKLMYDHGKKDNNVMILDCGGGTTDLASCRFKVEDEAYGKKLILETCFENGNPNFGGNNLTYRIMQLLKIKIAAALKPELIDYAGDAIKLIGKTENEILGLIESGHEGKYDSDHANEDVYKCFTRNYEAAEEIIPTKYVGNKKFRGTEALKKIKRNFHYLWRQAEEMKIDFYKSEKVQIDFEGGSKCIQIRNHENYYLYVCAGEGKNTLDKRENPFENVSITINEIKRVICGDIYGLLYGLFGDGSETNSGIRVEEFEYYKLSGQSCKISLFSELLKEYIPGRRFRPAFNKNKGSGVVKSEDLKIDCIKGSISYIRDQLRPEMKIETIAEAPKLIYDIYLEGKYDKDKQLFDCTDSEKILYEIASDNTKECPLVIKSVDGVTERKFVFKLRNRDNRDEDWSEEEIRNKLCNYRMNENALSDQAIEAFLDDLRNITDGKSETINVVFAIPAKDGYGAYIGHIKASGKDDGHQYCMLGFKYENFEDASKTFFDGVR